MDGASLCICTVSSINNPRCAWHGGVPESPFVIMDCWRLHKPLSPAESALCQAPLASLGPSFPDGTPAGGPCPRVPVPSHGHLGSLACREGFVACRARAGSEEREQLGSFLLALAWEVRLFIGGFVGVSFPPPRHFSHLLKEKPTGQMLSVKSQRGQAMPGRALGLARAGVQPRESKL